MGILTNYINNPTDGKIRAVFALAAASTIGCYALQYKQEKFIETMPDARIVSQASYSENTQNCLRSQVMTRLYNDRKPLADALIAGKTIAPSDVGLTKDFYDKARADCHAQARPVIAKDIASNDPVYIGMELAKIPATILVLGSLLCGLVGIGLQAQQSDKKNTPKP